MTDFTAHRDVIVVGAGPVGLTAALLLADAGVRTTVVEKATAPGDLPRAISLQDESFRILEQIGVAEELKAESLLDTGSRYFGLDDVLLAEARPVPSRIGHPAKTQFDQPILEQLLFDRAVAHPDLELLLGTEATGLAQDTSGVLLEVTGPDGTATLRSDWLVAADGGRSFIRSSLGVKMVGSTQPQRWIVIDLLNETTQHDPYAEFHCDGKRPYVKVPGIKGRLRFEFMLFDHEDADAMTTPESIRELMRPFRAELDPDDVRRAAVYVAHQRVAETYRSGRVFLAGDAAHLMPPFAGQGLNAGMRDGSNIAWKLTEAVRGGATERLLDSYGTERRTHGHQMMKVSHRIGAVVMATGRRATRLRDATIQLLRKAPAVHDFLANMRFITPPDYSAGMAVPSASQSRVLPAAPVGRALAQPDVVDAAGTTAGLDTHLGNGWAVVGISADPAELDPYFQRLGVVPLRLDGPGTQDAAPGLRETTALLTEGHTGEPVFVLVRPDRYVAAVFTPDEQEQTVQSLRGFVDDRLRPAPSTR